MKTLTRYITLVAFFAISGCDRQAPDEQTTSDGQPLENISFRLAWVPDMAEVGVFVAKERGHFEREGFDVSIEPGGFGLDPIRMVAAGSNDFGVGGAGNLLIARNQSVPVVAIAAEFQNTPVGFIAHSESGISDFDDFRDQRVGVQTGADTDVLYRALLARNEMTSRDVSEVPIQFDMGPFVNNVIDVLPGYVTNQPITLANQGFDVQVITAESQGLQYYGNVFFTTEDRINSNPDQVHRFVRAIRAGWQEALDDKNVAIDSLLAHTDDFDREELEEIYDAVMPFINPDEEGVELLGMTTERWESTADVLIEAGLVEEVDQIGEAYTRQFLE